MFGIDLFDAALLPAMFVALTAGLLSFLSPCVLPIVPPYLAYISGISMAEMQGREEITRSRVVVPALFFVLGLSTIFLILGAATSYLGAQVAYYQRELNFIAGAVVVVFGLHFLGLFRIGFLDQEARINAGDRGGSAFGSYILGLAFAFGWTPCIGLQLSAILGLAASEGDVAKGTFLLAIYAIGLGVPFLLVAAFFPSLQGLMTTLKRHMRTIERVMGALLVAIGVAMITGMFAAMSYWLIETFPALAAIG